MATVPPPTPTALYRGLQTEDCSPLQKLFLLRSAKPVSLVQLYATTTLYVQLCIINTLSFWGAAGSLSDSPVHLNMFLRVYVSVCPCLCLFFIPSVSQSVPWNCEHLSLANHSLAFSGNKDWFREACGPASACSQPTEQSWRDSQQKENMPCLLGVMA